MSAPFTVQDTPVGGKRAIATRPIARGELILEEAPLVTQQGEITEESVAAALSQLPRDAQRHILSLPNAWKGGFRALVGLWITNAMPCGTPEDPTGDDTNVDGIFPLVARLNSSCRPNVIPSWVVETQKMQCRAVRPIAAGEELCITRADLLLTRDDRRAWLKDGYNIDCNCAACCLTGQQLLDSDARRAFAFKALAETEPGDPASALYKVQLALRMLEEEGLLDVCAKPFYTRGFELCISIGDVEGATASAKKAWEFERITRGPESPSARRWEEILKNSGIL